MKSWAISRERRRLYTHTVFACKYECYNRYVRTRIIHCWKIGFILKMGSFEKFSAALCVVHGLYTSSLLPTAICTPSNTHPQPSYALNTNHSWQNSTRCRDVMKSFSSCLARLWGFYPYMWFSFWKHFCDLKFSIHRSYYYCCNFLLT